MTWLRAIAWTALAALPCLAVQERGGADPVRETFAKTAIDLDPEHQLSFRYRTIAWSAEGAARMRSDPAQREQMNQRLGVGVQSELTTPVALSVAGRRLEPGTYRLGLRMNAEGAYELTLLLEFEFVPVPIDLFETRQTFPYLTFCLLPAPAGGYALVFQWGTEYGRLVLELAR